MQCIPDPVVYPATGEDQAGNAEQQERAPQEFAAGGVGRGSCTAQPVQPPDLQRSRCRRLNGRIPGSVRVALQPPQGAFARYSRCK